MVESEVNDPGAELDESVSDSSLEDVGGGMMKSVDSKRPQA